MKTEGRSPGLGPDQFGTGQQQGRSLGQPEADDLDAFARAMAKPAGTEEPRRTETDLPRPEWGGAGDAILRGLAGARPMPTVEPEAAGRSRLVEELAERVLVSEPEASGGREVRITVKDSHFPGLEVRIAERQGRLEVVLVCREAADVALLRGQVSGLLERLGRRTTRQVEVRVERADEGGAEDEAGRAAGFPPPERR